MVRIFFLAAGLSCLGACSWSGPGAAGGASWQSGIPSSQAFRFDWQLSGDPAVAPLQVFDDGRETWLQFLPGQPLPAIFGMGDSGEHPLPYVRRDPYVVVAGAWKGLSFRGGRLTARARRPHAAANPAREPASASRLALSTAAGPDQPQRLAQDASASITLSADTPARSAGHATAGPQTLNSQAAGVAPPAAHEAGNAGPQAAPQAATFRAAPPDATLRAVLARWADSAGWTFHPQHWAVDVDIPLAATAEFPGDFKTAVRGLLGATELADRPLQPCFYANRVLRVVPLAQSCSRVATPKGAAA